MTSLLAALIAAFFGFGIMALLAAAFGTVERHVTRPHLRSVTHGLLFGCGAILVMLEPVRLGEGLIIDARAIIVGMAAAFGGWPAAVLSALMAASWRLYLGGVGAPTGVTGILLVALLGQVWAWRLKPKGHVSLRALAGLGAFIALYTTTSILLPWQIFSQMAATVIPVIVLACILGAVVMGSLIEREQVYIRAETGWKNSAHTDPLTGIPNRRWFQDTLDHDLSRSTGPASHLLLIIDADHFKRINDRYGHAAGDAALVFIANIMRGRTRNGDAICRLGGEEFAVFVPDTSREAAERIANALHAGISDTDFTFEDTVIPLTVSIGAVLWCPRAGTATPDLLFRAADAALYTAKESGRNQVVFAGDPGNIPDSGQAGIGILHPARPTGPDQPKRAYGG